jgi:tRNA A-37 threonylcarbamoyl transferase component Bud32/tetratricopeptide (TPR) repeat protein
MAVASSAFPFEAIPGLRVERELASGAFGVVYLATDTVIGRVVALKVLRASKHLDSPEIRSRLLGEARAAGGIRSSHVVTLFHVHPLAGGDVALEMEFMEGGSLEDLIGADRRLPVETATEVLRAVALGLGAAHAAGVVHGDVKPANVLRTKDGVFKIADFGLARILGAPTAEAEGVGAAGTPPYMAPEVVMEEPATRASDIWSLGVLAYRMLAGRSPFAGSDTVAVCFSILNDAPPPLGPEVPATLARLVERCLSKRASDRPGSCEEVLAALDGVAPAPARRPGAVEEPAGAPIGRDSEARVFANALRRAAGAAGTVVAVGGPAGIGKSAFLRHAAALARSSAHVVELGHATGHGLLSSLARALDAGSAGAPRGTAADVDVGAEHRLWRAEKDLVAFARDRPVVVVVDEFHDASDDDAAAMRSLARRLSRERVLWLVARRADERDAGGSPRDPADWVGEDASVRIDLGPLDPASVRRLAQDRTGARLDPVVAERVAEKAGGNPLFAIQILQHLLETGAAVRDAGTVSPGPEWGSVKLPPRLRDLLARRLAAVSAPTRDLLDVAAVDGVEFDTAVLCAVVGQPPLKVLRQLQRLYREHALVVPTAEGFRFAHPLLRDIVYEEVAPELRREIHGRIAAFLEVRRPPTDPARLGTHWHLGGDGGRAAPLLREAARVAETHQEQVRAVELAERSGLVPGRIDAPTALAHFDLLLRLARCYGEIGRDEEMASLCSALLGAAESEGDEIRRLQVVVTRDHRRYFRGGVAGIDEAAIRRAAEVLPDSPALGRARYLLGVAAKYRGDLAEAERWLRGADAQFVALREEGRHGAALDQLASVAMRAGRIREAETLYAEAAAVCRRAGRILGAAVSEGNGVAAALQRGQVEGLEPRLEEAIRTFTLEGARNHAAWATVILARVRYAGGDLPRARASIEEAHRHLSRSGYLPGLVDAENELGHLAMVAGDLAGAARALDAARAAATRQGNVEGAVLSWASEAQRRCFAGSPTDASKAISEAIAAAKTTSEPLAYVHLLHWAAEARLYGLPAADVDAVGALARRDGVDELLVVPRALAAGALALTSKSGEADALLDAAGVLGGPGVGERRAALRAIGVWFEAGAFRRQGEEGRALERGRAARDAAIALGHVGLEAAIRRWLEGVPSA